MAARLINQLGIGPYCWGCSGGVVAASRFEVVSRGEEPDLLVELASSGQWVEAASNDGQIKIKPGDRCRNFAGYLENKTLCPCDPEPWDHVERTLLRRIRGLVDLRQARALSEGGAEDFHAWSALRDRSDRLKGLLIAHLDGKPIVNVLAPPKFIAIHDPGEVLRMRGNAEAVITLLPAITFMVPVPATMSAPHDMHPLNHAQQSAVLSKGTWIGADKIRIKSTVHTERILKQAGIQNPKPLESYDLPVKRDGQGFVVLADREGAPPVESGDGGLFEPGGLFSAQRNEALTTAVLAQETQMLTESTRVDLAPELAALAEIPCTRTFEVPWGGDKKFRIQVVAFEDQSLPSPNEPEQWKPVKMSDGDISNLHDHLYLAGKHGRRPLIAGLQRHEIL